MAGLSQFNTTGDVIFEGVRFNNGVIDVNGTANAIVLDSAGTASISAPTNGQIDIEIAGADDFTVTANSFNVLSGSTIAGPSTTFYWCAPISAQQDLSGAGAVNITAAYTAFTSTGAGDALTLVDGAVKGHYKKITHVVDGGSGVLTPSNLSGGTTITFTTINEVAELVFDGTDWVAVALYNTAAGGTPPVLA